MRRSRTDSSAINHNPALVTVFAQITRASRARVVSSDYLVKARQLRSAITQSADGLIAYHVVAPIGILRSFPSSDWKRVLRSSPPPRFNCKLKHALALPLQGLLISIRTSGCYARYVWGQMDVCCGVEGEIFGGAILARIFGMCNNSIRRLIAFITFPLLHRCSVMRSCFKFQIIGNEFSSLILKCVVEINIINKFLLYNRLARVSF